MTTTAPGFIAPSAGIWPEPDDRQASSVAWSVGQDVAILPRAHDCAAWEDTIDAVAARGLDPMTAAERLLER